MAKAVRNSTSQQPLPHSVSAHVSRVAANATAAPWLRSRSAKGLAAAVALAALPATQAQAQLGAPDFTASQQVTISGDYLPPQSFDAVPFSDSYSGNSLGSSEFDFSSINGIEQGSASWNNTLDSQGFIRSDSELSINHQFGSGEGDFSKLKVDVFNTVSYFDFIKVEDLAPPGSPDAAPFEDPYIIRFETRLTGDLSNTVNYSDPSVDGASKAEYSSYVEYSGRIASTSGDADEPFDIGDTYSNLGTPGPFGENVDESDTVLADIFFVDQTFYLDDGVFFGFDYTDTFSVDIEFIDAGSIDILMKNDLGSTVVTTASIFDMNGRLMPNLRAYSEAFDFDFAPNFEPPTPGPVPVPATAWLVISALGGLLVANRKKRIT